MRQYLGLTGSMDVHVVCGIAQRHGKVMVARRLETGGTLGAWEFPGGKVQPGETAEAALIREFKEELDLEVAILESIACSLYDQPGRRLCLHAYAIEWLSGTPQLSVHSELRWVSPSELATWEDFSEPDRPFLAWFLRQDPRPIS